MVGASIFMAYSACFKLERFSAWGGSTGRTGGASRTGRASGASRASGTGGAGNRLCPFDGGLCSASSQKRSTEKNQHAKNN